MKFCPGSIWTGDSVSEAADEASMLSATWALNQYSSKISRPGEVKVPVTHTRTACFAKGIGLPDWSS